MERTGPCCCLVAISLAAAQLLVAPLVRSRSPLDAVSLAHTSRHVLSSPSVTAPAPAPPRSALSPGNKQIRTSSIARRSSCAAAEPEQATSDPTRLSGSIAIAAQRNEAITAVNVVRAPHTLPIHPVPPLSSPAIYHHVRAYICDILDTCGTPSFCPFVPHRCVKSQQLDALTINHGLSPLRTISCIPPASGGEVATQPFNTGHKLSIALPLLLATHIASPPASFSRNSSRLRRTIHHTRNLRRFTIAARIPFAAS